MTAPRLPLAPVVVEAEPDTDGVGFRVHQGERYHPCLDWGEMVLQITALTWSPESRPRFPMLTADEWAERDRRGDEQRAARQAEDTKFVSLRIPKAEAEQLSSALSDVLCWAAGFAAANYDRGVSGPMGIEQLRDLNRKLKAALYPADFEEVF
ncbi:hypothetical protein [Xanthobacter aminoxidans]|uniref:hypothetical protein n=1 Tax=Xanthobacter aminoxidans TaxID=186280 RepID=UPI002022D105|nr:hypothetical protein [Xanthobacter aminoxidans]MCL8382098.1 hypothetical protein [Xanthobacter aminoxidans]